ncbi:MAG TPA: beta galactosidase jelly roll domain-containing protein, partial [Polyangiaceae bacterium]
RRPASFARVFETLLGNSQDGGNIATVSGGLKAYVRKSPSNGTVVFLDNQGTSSVQTQVKLSSPAIQFPSGSAQLSVASNEIRPVVVSAPWTANATFSYLATSVLGSLTLAKKSYYVCHGRAGEAGEIAVQFNTAPATAPATPWNYDSSTKLARATFNYPTGDTISEFSLDSGDGSSAMLLVINSALADRTWFTDDALYVGATYVDEGIGVQLPAAGGKVTVYSSSGRSELTQAAVTIPTLPAIGSWQWRDAAPEAAPNFDDASWASSPQPKPFGAYNFQNGYGWYRAQFTAAAAGSVTAKIGGGVRASAVAFANGSSVRVNSNSFTFSTVAGTNTVAILAKQEGLDKMYNVTGATGTGQYAGIWGSVTIDGSALAQSWKFRGGLGGMDETAVVGLVKNWTTFLGGTWSDTQTTKSWPAFFRGTFKSPLRSDLFLTVGIRTTGMSSGSAWVNGHNIGRFSGNTLLYVPEGWLTTDNTVVIYDASGSSPSGVKLEYFETRARQALIGTGGAGGAGGSSGLGGASSGGGRSGAGGANTSSGSPTGGTTSVSNSGGARAIGGGVGSGGSPIVATGGSMALGGTSTTAASVVGGKSSTGTLASTGGIASPSGGGTGGVVNVSTAGGARGEVSSATNGASDTDASDSGCSCTTAGHARNRSVWVALGAALLLLGRSRVRATRRLSSAIDRV